jgi:hypothetical protein
VERPCFATLINGNPLATTGAIGACHSPAFTSVARFALGGHPIADMAEMLTQELVADGTARAETVVRAPGDDRCYSFRGRIEDVQASWMPQGRRRFGWILANGGRENWDVWLDLHSGEGRLRRQLR